MSMFVDKIEKDKNRHQSEKKLFNNFKSVCENILQTYCSYKAFKHIFNYRFLA